MQKRKFLLLIGCGITLIFIGISPIFKPSHKNSPSISPLQKISAQKFAAKTPAVETNTEKPEQEEELVTKVIDGDTIELEGGKRVRYIGINTPELHHPKKGVECYSKEAYKANRALVEGKRVILKKDISGKDRYGRLLRYVFVDNIFVNEQLVKEGYAMSVSYPPDIAVQTVFIQAEKVAQEQKKGLWGECK